MKILWISDFDTSTFPGGAQFTQALLLREGEQRHNISKYFFRGQSTPGVELEFDKYDLVISNTLINLWKTLLVPLKSIKHHIHISHDISPYLSPQNKKILFNDNLLTCFMSPEHIHSYIGYFVGDKYVLYPPIDTDIFQDYNQPRNVDCVWIGLFHPLKGIIEFSNYVKQNQEKSFILIGFGDESYIKDIMYLPNVNYLRMLKNELLPSVYNTSKSLFFSPQQDETFGRTVAEAIICGCNIITDGKYNIPSLNLYKRIGKDETKRTVQNSAIRFWEKIGTYDLYKDALDSGEKGL